MIQLQLFYILLLVITSICHIPDYVTTPATQVERYCFLAEKCMHDTVPICGVLAEDFRTFMDHCDMLEFACDTGKVYNHVDDEPGKNCPSPRPILSPIPI